MKKIALLSLFCISQFLGKSQSVTNSNSGAKFPLNYTPYGIIDNLNGDTLSWYGNETWTKNLVKSYSPIYGLNAFASSQSFTVSTSSVKTGSIIQVGWYGVSAIYSVTPINIYVPTSSIINGQQFVVKSSYSNSDSFWYFIWNHN